MIEGKNVSGIDSNIDKCFFSYKSCDAFFHKIANIIYEKCTRSILLKRAKVQKEDLDKWLFFRNPNYIFVEMNDEVIKNTPSLLEIYDKLRNIKSEKDHDKIQAELNDEIKKPKIWL